MSEKFQDRYRIPSIRASWWDYGRNASYFVTICTQDREYYFGNIVEKTFIPSQIGTIAQSCWYEIPQHFPYVQLDSFVVMPNHVHGIINIDKTDEPYIQNEPVLKMDEGMINKTNYKPIDTPVENSIDAPVENPIDTPVENSIDTPVETRLIASLQPAPSLQNQPSIETTTTPKLIGGITGEINPMLHDNLSRIIRWYKGRTTFESHKFLLDFAWQARFYDTIIHGERSYQIKSDYITNNPAKWNDDQFYLQ